MVVGLEFYQHQHASLLQVATALGDGLAAGWTAGSAETARQAVVSLSGKLTVHLQMEDHGLYPALLASTDPEVRSVAARFQHSMGGLKADADGFFRRWISPDAIAGNPGLFRSEARALLSALTERIAAEDAQLYPLVERTS